MPTVTGAFRVAGFRVRELTFAPRNDRPYRSPLDAGEVGDRAGRLADFVEQPQAVGAQVGSSTLTVTLSKKASTGGRSLAIAVIAPSKSSRATASSASALATSIASASSLSSGLPVELRDRARSA